MSASASTPSPDPDAAARRRRALQRYAILDTPPEPAFDRLADLAAHLLDAPIALVTFADANRLWFKACLGLDRRETDLDASFCAHTLRARDVLVVEEASADPRFADTPLVAGAPGVRFYAGAPLVTPDGHVLGTLCVMDTEPRAPSAAQLEQLDNLAAVVVDELELRREATERRRSEQRFQDVVQAAGEYVWETDATGRYTSITEQAETVKGRPADALLGRRPTELMPDADASHTRRVLDTARATGEPFTLEHRTTTPDGTLRWEQVRGRPILDDDGTLAGFRGTGLDVTARKEASMRLRLQSETLSQIARGEPLTRILGTMVESVEAQRPGMTGSVLFYDAETNTIRHGVAPNLPDAYNAAIDGLEVGPTTGSCGTAMHLRSTVIADDIETDPRWTDYRDLALAHGLRACWSTPLVTDDGEVLGSFALYYDEPATPSEADRAIIDTARTLARIAIERHRDVAALRRSESRLRGLANSVPGVLYSMYRTPDDRYISTFIGAQAESMFGIPADPPEDFSDRFLRRIPPSHREAVNASVDRALEAGETWSATFPFERPDGETIWVRGRAAPEPHGDRVVLNGVLLDVTRERERERDLRHTRTLLESIVDTVGVGICVTDPDRRFVSVNSSFTDLYGWTREELIGEPFTMVAAPSVRAAAAEAHNRFLREGEDEATGEWMIQRKDGTLRDVLITVGRFENKDGTPHKVTSVLDVTDRKRTETNLRKERDLLENIFNASAAAITVRDADGQIIRANDRAEEVLGLAVSDVEGRRYDDPAWSHTAVDGGPFPEEKQPFVQVMRTEAPVYDVRHAIEWPDGRRRILSVNGAPLRDETGTVHRAVFVVEDITEREQKKAALRRSRQRWQRLVENHRDPILITVDGRIHYINPAGAALFGASDPEAIIGRKALDFASDDELTDVLKARRAMLEQGRPTPPLEHTIRRLDGEERIIEAYSVPIEFNGHRAAQTVLHDVTQQREAERALRKSEARLRGLANSLPGVIFQAYVRDDDTYGTHFVSAQARSLLGLDPDREPFLERFAARVARSHRPEVLRSLRHAADTGNPWDVEFPFVPPGGETIWVRGIATPETRDGEQVFNGVLLDITRRKNLEDQLLQAQKMETVGTLAGGIAHDFNNILHATTAYLELLADELPDGLALHTILDQAFTGLDRASGLVDRLLTFSRAEGKAVETTVDLSAVVIDTIELARPALPPEVHLRTEAPADCFVLGDPGQLQQVVMNLITNAAQAMETDPGDGVLDVAVRTMRVDRDLARRHLHLEAGRYVRLTVSDTGSGMDADTQARIFEPFFTTKDVDRGTGLGLSVVHGIVQAHDGDIGVYSEPDEGTSFHVYLPATGPDEGAEADVSRPASAHLLLVDDDAQVRDLETVRLTRMGYRVTAVADADAALDALSEAPDTYDLMITDYLMPGLNGLELVLRLRDRGHTLPVFIMSGFSARISEPDVLQAGAFAFLRKPVGSRELDQTITAALQGEEPR